MATITDIKVCGTKLAFVHCKIDGRPCDVDLSGNAHETVWNGGPVSLSAADLDALRPALDLAIETALKYGPVEYHEPRD